MTRRPRRPPLVVPSRGHARAFGLAIGAALAVQAVALQAIRSAAASAPDASA